LAVRVLSSLLRRGELGLDLVLLLLELGAGGGEVLELAVLASARSWASSRCFSWIFFSASTC
jgi:hypothetical protein